MNHLLVGNEVISSIMGMKFEGHILVVLAFVPAEEGNRTALWVYADSGGRSFTDWATMAHNNNKSRHKMLIKYG